MDYSKLERWIREILQEEEVYKITNIDVLAEDIVNAVKEWQND